MKTAALNLAFAFLLIAAVSAVAQKGTSVQIRRIDAYAKSIDRITNKKQEPDVIFADTSQGDDKPKWEKFDSTKALDKFREATETYTVAYNWTSKGTIVASNFTLFSPSGDWAKYVNHYFRADGSLAKVTSELRTFYGDYIVIEALYFDAGGRRLKRGIKYLDLTTKKPRKPTSDFLSDNSMTSGVDYFKRTKHLPFAVFLKTK